MSYACSLTFTASLLAGWLMIVPAFGIEIIAHRGASFDAPENTLAAINLAWRQNADAVEIDIFLTADGEIVAIHDKTTKRTGGGKDKPVVEQTLAELRTLDFGAWKAPKFAGERIATLAEILRTIPDGKRLFIEIKTEEEILPELARVLKASGKSPDQTALISFSYETIRAAKERLPAIKAFWIVKLENDKETGRPNHTADELVEKVRAARLDGLDLGNAPPLTPEFVGKVKSAGLELYVWTVNEPDKGETYRALGLDGITTDRPDLLRERLKDGRLP